MEIQVDDGNSDDDNGESVIPDRRSSAELKTYATNYFLWLRGKVQLLVTLLKIGSFIQKNFKPINNNRKDTIFVLR